MISFVWMIDVAIFFLPIFWLLTKVLSFEQMYIFHYKYRHG